MKPPEITREMIVGEARRKADQLGTTVLSRDDFERKSEIGQYHIYRLFPEGGWSEIRSLAGLQRHPQDNEPQSDDQLLAEFHRVVSTLGKIPTWARFGALANVSEDTVRRRFGGTSGTLSRYRRWLDEHEPQSLLIGVVDSKIASLDVATTTSGERTFSTTAPVTEWSKNYSPEYGSPIDFRGLRHAPINEQGVVYLFGVVSFELGFLVEAIHTAFPDCEAKRCIDRRNDRWQRVRIEFEYRSRHYLDHGHPFDGCDLVVCWENNWLDCPLEVVELRQKIKELPGLAVQYGKTTG